MAHMLSSTSSQLTSFSISDVSLRHRHSFKFLGRRHGATKFSSELPISMVEAVVLDPLGTNHVAIGIVHVFGLLNSLTSSRSHWLKVHQFSVDRTRGPFYTRHPFLIGFQVSTARDFIKLL